ncbi:hypothetical protein ACSU6B_29045, partial [Neobacillus sp. C211]|uniref:hypothetical protein n=1 Tax=unclassified Neobacillus TaxID=2675272 RepID=UPI0039784694
GKKRAGIVVAHAMYQKKFIIIANMPNNMSSIPNINIPVTYSNIVKKKATLFILLRSSNKNFKPSLTS